MKACCSPMGMEAPSMIYAAETFARVCHAGQFRRDGITPYITHPEAVVAMLSGQPDEVIATAWLHDVMEDSEATHADMEAIGIPANVIEAVATLTKGCESYPDYLEFVKANQFARVVKIADMLHNLTSSPSPKQVEKYVNGILFLST